MLGKSSVVERYCGIRRENKADDRFGSVHPPEREETAEHFKHCTDQSFLKICLPAVDQWSVLITLPNQISLGEPHVNRGRTPRKAV